MSSGLVLDASAQVLKSGDFERLSAFIHRMTGIKMPPSKRSMVEGRLRRRLVATGSRDFAAYCAEVFAGGDDGPEIVHLLDAVTTNKTDFFREPEHFRILTDTVLPALATEGRKVKIWSAASSTGAEAYTLAIVVSEFILAQRGKGATMPPPSILATDLCTTVLETALQGIYPADFVEPVPPALRKRYLRRSKNSANATVRIVPELRAMVRFGRMNLMAPQYDADRDFDIIFLRNVLIYFDREGQTAVLRRLCDHLRPGGTLAVGHSESLNGMDLPLKSIGHAMFRRS